MKSWKSFIGIVIVFVIIVFISMMNINVNEAKDYTNITKDSIVLKLNTNKMLVNGVSKMLDSENPRTMPYLDENSRTLVPIRCISENLGAIVEWNQKEQVATITYGTDVIKFTIGSNRLDKNGQKFDMDTTAIIYEDRTYIPIRALSEIGLEKEVYWDNDTQLIVISDSNEYVEKNITLGIKDMLTKDLDSLSFVGDFNILQKLIKNDNNRYYLDDFAINEVAGTTDSIRTSAQKSESAQDDYSKTNTQVAGVDEADIVKTNGKYIFYLSANKLVVTDVRTPENMKIVKEIDYNTDDNVEFIAEEMYLDDNSLVVIGNETTRTIIDYGEESVSNNLKLSKATIGIVRPMYKYDTKVKMICYDISSVNNMIVKRTVKSDGYYVSSRKVNDDIYVISNKYLYTYGIDFAEANQDDYKPEYYDSVVTNEYIKVDFGDIMYFPEIDDNSYSMITSFNVTNLLKANVETFLGMSGNIYMDEDTLYVAQTEYNWKNRSEEYIKTNIYKFDVKNEKVTYDGKGQVTGYAINQFSMDEYNGYFRIATTNSKYTDERSWNALETNELHILTNGMKEIASITGLAENETIQSVRFIGNRVYLVTYEQTDPLFVIDTTDPYKPEVLGKLKIEGFSTYLHPYDENHIIGFGMDTELIETDDRVETHGMKVALFDVTDPTNPVEMFVEKIGEYGTYSTLLYDHKALLFDKNKNLLAFPIMIFGTADKNNYMGELEKVGAIIYEIDLEKGFVQKGMITHLSNIKNINDLNYKQMHQLYNGIVNRIVYAKDKLYTLSYNMIKCSNMNNLVEVSRINIDVSEDNNYYYLY